MIQVLTRELFQTTPFSDTLYIIHAMPYSQDLGSQWYRGQEERSIVVDRIHEDRGQASQSS